MTNALTLARLCMGANELEPATGALHKAAELLDRLKEITSGQPIEKGRVRLEAEYHAMRMALVSLAFPSLEVIRYETEANGQVSLGGMIGLTLRSTCSARRRF